MKPSKPIHSKKFGMKVAEYQDGKLVKIHDNALECARSRMSHHASIVEILRLGGTRRDGLSLKWHYD